MTDRSIMIIRSVKTIVVTTIRPASLLSQLNTLRLLRLLIILELYSKDIPCHALLYRFLFDYDDDTDGDGDSNNNDNEHKW